jgi:hypothetical protein
MGIKHDKKGNTEGYEEEKMVVPKASHKRFSFTLRRNT